MVGGGGASAAKASSGGRVGVRIVVAGDKGTGKSSLIVTAAADTFPINVPPLLPPTRLPDDLYPDRVPVTIIDTSSSMENRGKLAEELKRADAVVLTYACDQPATLDRLSTFWLPELRRLEVKVPVIVVGCKLDLRDEQHPLSLEQVLSPIMQQFREIETCIECSAFKQIQVPEVFCYAQKAVLHPRAPLFDQEAQTLKPRCVRALKRIFILCDHDRDGALSDAELNDFQVKCFNAPLQPSEIVGVKRVVQEKLPEGVNDRGLTLTGFLVLHTLFIEKGRLETTWTVLRKFGYNNDIRLNDDQLPPPIKRAPDQSVELISEALDFLRGIFRLFDIDGDGALNRAELEDFFSTAPESPWDEAPFKDAAERTALGGLSLERFLSEAKGSHYLLAKPECNKDSTMCSPYNAVRFLYESLYIKHDYNAVRFLYEYLYIRHDRALIEAFNKDKLKAPNEIREEKALNTFAKAGANLDMKDATKQDPLETEASSQTPTKGGASPVLTLSPDLKEGLGGSGSLPSIAEHGHPAGSSPLQETEKSLSPTQSREGSSKAKFVAEIQVAIEQPWMFKFLTRVFQSNLLTPCLSSRNLSLNWRQLPIPTIEGPEDGAQSALTKASEKTDLPEIIEEADMDELFESMKDIVTSTVSGILGSGAGSSAQPTFGSEEVINAKETLKAALKMNIKNALHPGRTSTLREAIRVLIATKVLPSSADAALASFGHDFSTFNQNFEGITRDLQIVDEKLEEATVLTIEVSQKSAAWEILRPKIEANKKEKAEALKKIQEAEERLKSAQEELQQVEVRAKGYDDEKKEMFSRTRFSKTKLLVMDVQSLFSSREQLDLQFQGMVATWEGLRRNVFGHL